MEKLLARLQGRRAALLVLGLGSTTVAVFLLALIGFFSLGTSGDGDGGLIAGPGTEDTVPGEETTDTTVASTDTTAVTGPTGSTPGGTGPGGTSTTPVTYKDGSKFVPEAPPPPGEAPLPKGGNATGVSKTTIRYGVHAPTTFNKAPVPLAGPVMRGIDTYRTHLNSNGGINGRAIDLRFEDDEFTVGGAGTAGERLINEHQVFLLAGTLGVDQIKVVADKANKAKVPYFAGGGHEPLFNQMNLFQILSSYDTHVQKLADFLGTDPAYKGKKIGTLTSNTAQITPVVKVFDEALKKYGMRVNSNQTVEKPEQQSAAGYRGKILAFTDAEVDVVVPLTDPINTSGLIRECAQTCRWTYSFSNFAHDGETALALFGDEWGRKKVRGLSGGCYPNSDPAVMNNPAKCSSMGQAKAQFEAVHGAGSWTSTRNDKWGASTGYNSAAGYQWLFFKKAVTDLGSEVTRERLVASIKRYNGYRDLVTGPITYKGTTNYAHGAELMVVWEAQTSNKYKMISDGMVAGF